MTISAPVSPQLYVPQGTPLRVPAPVNPEVCVPHETHFAVRGVKSIWRWSPFSITDEQDRLVFEVEGWKSGKMRRRIKDGSGKVVLTITVKIGNFVNTWKAFHGDSTESQLLFIVKDSFLPWFDHAVFLPDNNDTSTPDFTVRRAAFGNYFTVVFNGMPIAQYTHRRFKIAPGVDRIFIAALLTINRGIKRL